MRYSRNWPGDTAGYYGEAMSALALNGRPGRLEGLHGLEKPPRLVFADAKLRTDRVLLELVGEKWTVLVFGSLCDHGGRRRFNAIRRDIPGISQKSLTQCLRRLERNGLLQRHVCTDVGRLAVESAA
jgi:hypothetical protein